MRAARALLVVGIVSMTACSADDSPMTLRVGGRSLDPVGSGIDGGRDAPGGPASGSEDAGAAEDAALDADVARDATVDAGVDATSWTGGDAAPWADDAHTSDDAPDDRAIPIDAVANPTVQGTITYVAGVGVSTLAGSSVAGTKDGTGSAAELDNPTGIAVDLGGNLLVTDYDSSRVRLVTPGGTVTTLTTASPTFVNPFSAVVASDGTYYVGTDADSRGVKDVMTGTIWRVPVPQAGWTSIPVVVAQGFARPRGLAPTASSDIFVADRNQGVVETVESVGYVTFLAGQAGKLGFADGTGASALFDQPIGVAALPGGAGWLVADSVNNRIRQVTPDGTVTTIAGNGSIGINDGPCLSAVFDTPRAIAVDAAGNAYVSDGGNHRIRRIGVDGNVDTLAGDGVLGFADGDGADAEFYGQEGIAVTSDGKTVYVADGNGGDGSAHNRIRAISIPSPPASIWPVRVVRRAPAR